MASVQASRNELPRYSDRPFPIYRFVPGHTPHPTKDPTGHSYGRAEEVLTSFGADHWRTCPQYLYGVDLFNHEYWWEAHEVWEAVWNAAGRRSDAGLFVQGLIQISVAQLKLHQGFEEPARRLASYGLTKMSGRQGTYLGIDVAGFRLDVGARFWDNRSTSLRIKLVQRCGRHDSN